MKKHSLNQTGIFSQRRKLSVLFFFIIFPALFFCLTAETYKIRNINYDIDGSTREYPLSKNLDIEETRIFTSKEEFETYIADLRMKLMNERVLSEGSIDVTYGEPDASGMVPADLLIKTKDTINIIAVPYPKFTSNDGLELKLKLKNYNFMGSMEELNADVVYEYDPDDEDTPTTIGGNLDFEIPFMMFGQEFTWSVDSMISVPVGEPAEFTFDTVLDYERELIPERLDFHAGVSQEVYVYPRDSDEEMYEDDPLYFGNNFYVNFPVTIFHHDYFDDFIWTPEISLQNNWSPKGITDDDLKGTSITFSHSASFGRYNWIENYRRGVDFSLSNGWTYNFITSEKKISVETTVRGYTPILSFLGISGRMFFMYDWESDGDLQKDMGSYMRGIIDGRIDTDAAFFFNLDLPVKIMDIDFDRTTGVDWTRYISFEMHISPFFDFGLTHDQYTDRYFSFDDAWYSAGLEMIVFPKKMRSIYGRISVGFDMKELIDSNLDFGASAKRDGGDIMEIFIGVGLEY